MTLVAAVLVGVMAAPACGGAAEPACKLAQEKLEDCRIQTEQQQLFADPCSFGQRTAQRREQAARAAAERYIRKTGPIPSNVDYFVERTGNEWRVVVLERQRREALANGAWEVEVRMKDPSLELIDIVRGQ